MSTAMTEAESALGEAAKAVALLLDNDMRDPPSAEEIAVTAIRAYLSDEAWGEKLARAIYAVELAREENVNSLIIRISRKAPHPSTRIETFEESAESWCDYSRAVLSALMEGVEE